MSTLENIRKRPGLVIGIVGFAILLFIFTAVDGCDRLMQGDITSAAKVAGRKIEQAELSRRTQEAYDAQRDQYRQRGMNPENVNYQQVEQQVLQQLIAEALLEKSMDDLGIAVTDDELSQILFADPVMIPELQQLLGYAQQIPDANIVTAADLYRYVKSNNTETGSQLRQAWKGIEDNTRSQLRQAKYYGQLQALGANKLDAKAYYDDNARSATIAMLRQDYTTLPDNDFSVSPDEVKARYNQDKEMFRIPQEQRLVDYILVRPTPSSDDYADAQREVEETIINLKSTPDLDAVSGNYNFNVETIEGPVDAITDNLVKNAIPALEADTTGVRMIQFANNNYTIAKLLGKYVAADSAYIDVLIVEKAKADSVIAKLNAGVKADSIGEAVLQSQLDMAMPTINSDFDMLKEQYAKAGQGVYFVLDMPNAADSDYATISRLNRYNSQKDIVKVAKITRPVVPSNTTLNNLDEKLRGYIADHKSIEAFKDSAANYQFTVLNTIVDASSNSFNGLPSSGKAVVWVMDNDKGEVSETVYTDNERSYFLAVALDNIYDGYVPASDESVNNYLTSLIRNEKKGQKLVADYKGKANDLAGYASLMKTSVDTIANVSYGRDGGVRGIVGGDPKFFASFANAKKGQLVGPVDTRNSVVVYQVVDEQLNPREFNFEQDAQAFNQNMGAARLLNRLNAILLGNKKVDYQVQKFIGGE